MKSNMFNIIYKSNQQGVTLLEAVVAIFVLLIGLMSAVVLILSSIISAGKTKNELIAANIAREAIEVIRAQRDSNWLEINTGVSDVEWDAGLYNDNGGVTLPIYEAVLTIDDAPPVPTLEWSIGYADNPADTFDMNSPEVDVYYNIWAGSGDKVYNQYLVPPGATEIKTDFKRLVTTKPICYDGVDEAIINTGLDCEAAGEGNKIGIQILVNIQWNEKDKIRSYTQEDRIYNWK